MHLHVSPHSSLLVRTAAYDVLFSRIDAGAVGLLSKICNYICQKGPSSSAGWQLRLKLILARDRNYSVGG
jgi:hypothetical protein